MNAFPSVSSARIPSDPVDRTNFRNVCSNFITGVVVVTSGNGRDASGITVNSFTSVSLDPPLVLVCIHNESSELPTLRRTGVFTINMLTAGQADVCRAFAGRGTRRLADIDTHTGITGAPIISKALAYLECRIDRQVSGGDHMIIIGEVLGLSVLRDSEPLTFFRNQHRPLEVG